MKKTLLFITLLLFIFSLNPVEAEVGREGHNCSMWAIVSDSLPDSLVFNHLIGYPRSLKYLSSYANPDGWGIASYSEFGSVPTVDRGAIRAINDPNYSSAVLLLENSDPKVILAHVRNCTSGCCCHDCDSIPDPHPFVRFKDGKYWTFIHNGSADIQLLYELIGEFYFVENPPDGSGIPECDPSDSSLVVDSELLFLYLLKNLDENDWDVPGGIHQGMMELIRNDSRGRYNFVLSDGFTVWAFRYGLPLYYLADSSGNFCSIASIYPTEEVENWQLMYNYTLVIANPDEEPLVIEPNYMPGDFNGDKRVIGGDVTYGVNYFSGHGEAPPDSCFNDSTGSWFHCAADVNGDCRVIGSDITYLINYFRGGNRDISWCDQTPPLDLLE